MTIKRPSEMTILARLMVELKTMGMSEKDAYKALREISNDDERVTYREMREAVRESGYTKEDRGRPLLVDPATDTFNEPRHVGKEARYPAYLAQRERQKALEAAGTFPEGTVDRMNRNYVAGHLLRVNAAYGTNTDLVRHLNDDWRTFERGNFEAVEGAAPRLIPGSP